MIWCATIGSCSRRAEPEDNGVKDVRSGAEGMGENGGPVDWVLVPTPNGCDEAEGYFDFAATSLAAFSMKAATGFGCDT